MKDDEYKKLMPLQKEKFKQELLEKYLAIIRDKEKSGKSKIIDV